MAFPSSSGSKTENLASAWYTARQSAADIKKRSQNLWNLCNTSDVKGLVILEYAEYLSNKKSQLDAITSITGIGAYAQDQINDPTLNVGTEYAAMASAIDGVISWIITNMPKDGSGYILTQQFNGDNSGKIVQRTFNPTATQGLRTQLLTLIGTID